MNFRFFVGMVGATLVTVACAAAKPTLFIIGDSTVRNSSPEQMGWGDPLVAHFDPAKIDVVNRAIGGRSSRTFLWEGRWSAVMAHLKAGDFVLMQFGHNDGGPLNDGRCRASLRGIGHETEDIIRKSDGKLETVRSYGSYLKGYIDDAKSQGATPIVVSPVPRNIWKDGKIVRSHHSHVQWSREVAEREGALFIDFHHLLGDRYEAIGMEKTGGLFADGDHTHHSPSGAAYNAAVMASAIRGLRNGGLASSLLPGDLFLPSIFSDHMVLQRGARIPIWGTAQPGAEVEAKFAGRTQSAQADESGAWKIHLSPPENDGPHSLEVTSSGARRLYQDVMIGEVWLCSGRADMGLTSAGIAETPEVRIFTAKPTLREHPQREVQGKWTVGSAGNAMTYQLSQRLQQRTKGPVGLIHCGHEGSSIEAWICEDTLRRHPRFESLLQDCSRRRTAFRDAPGLFENYGKALAAAEEGPLPRHPDPVQDPRHPFVLHNGMIAPIAPYAIRGVFHDDRGIDADLLRIFTEDWRALWEMPEMPFDVIEFPAATP